MSFALASTHDKPDVGHESIYMFVINPIKNSPDLDTELAFLTLCDQVLKSVIFGWQNYCIFELPRLDFLQFQHDFHSFSDKKGHY